MRRDEVRRTFRRNADSAGDTLREIDEELELHLEWATEELIGEGWAPDRAREEARRRFGDLDGTRAYCAAQSGRARQKERWTMWWDDLLQDLRYAFRTLRKAPTYAGVVIATLAIGIAANTAVFSFMNPYLFRPLPFGEPDALVQIGGVDPVEGWDGGRFSVPQIEEMAERIREIGSIGGYYYGSVNLTGGDQAERRNASWFHGPLFETLDRAPILGRTLTEEDRAAGAPPVAVIGERMWELRFARDPGVLGTDLEIDGVPTTVVGVMPADFTFPFGGLDIWMPMPAGEAQLDRSRMVLLPVARLAEGADPTALKRELDRWVAENASLHPELDGRYSETSVKGLREALNFVWEVLPIAFALLLGSVAFVLIIACVNVASLTLARAGARNREVAVRAAIGADRSRLVRQLVTESFVLAAIGGVAGVVIASFVARLVNGIVPPDIFRVGDVSLDGRVLAFSALITLVTPFFFALLPAWRTARTPLATTLKEGARSGGARASIRTRRLLVISEVTLALVLVAGTGLMIRSLSAVTKVDLGFDADGLLTVVLSPSDDLARGAAELDAFWDRTRDELAALAEVTAAGSASHLPLNHETIPVRFASVQSGDRTLDQWPGAYTSRVDGDFFDAMGIELRAGRLFGPEDDVESGAVMISAEMADRLFPAGDAVGQTLLYGSATAQEPLRGTIVGVVEEIRYSGLNGEERPHLFRPIEGSTTTRRFLTLRTRGAPAEAIPAVRAALRASAPDAPAEIRPMGDVVRESTLLWAVSSLFLGVFGAVALGLAALGIYGLIAYSVVQRRREMGLRMALGADAGALTRSVVADGLRLAGIGLAIGTVILLAVGVAFERALLAGGVLVGVGATDPVTIGGALALFVAVAVAASLLPARRAAAANPLDVLRDD